MNLNELHESKKTKVVSKALREHYNIDMDFSRMDKLSTMSMLGRVRGLLKESRAGGDKYQTHTSPAYLKLVMLEQALSDHLRDIKTNATIVLENEEVQKSQVILAAQDMIDNVQKMLEDVSKMNVEELPAVVNGVKNEFGANEGDTFQQSASSALSALQEALTSAKQGLEGALGTITGEASAGPEADLGGELDASPDLGAEPEQEPEDDSLEMGELSDLDDDEEDEDNLDVAGRELR